MAHSDENMNQPEQPDDERVAIAISADSFEQTQPSIEDASSAAGFTINHLLSGTAPEPFTFESFIQFLSRNHCIEILNFIAEANSYSNNYQFDTSGWQRNSTGSMALGEQWENMLNAYIVPGGAHELNIPMDTRRRLMAIENVMACPPPPSELNPALHSAYDLLTESALIPFIVSFYGPEYRHRGSLSVSNHLHDERQNVVTASEGNISSIHSRYVCRV